MLVVGDAAHHIGKPELTTKIVSILVGNNNVDRLHKILDTDRSTFKVVSPHARIYKKKGKSRKSFLIMRTGANLYLQKFLQKSMATTNFRVATRSINYAFTSSLINIRHNDPLAWLGRVYQLIEGRKDFERTYKNLKERAALMATGRNLVDYFSQMDGFVNRTTFRPGKS